MRLHRNKIAGCGKASDVKGLTAIFSGQFEPAETFVLAGEGGDGKRLGKRGQSCLCQRCGIVLAGDVTHDEMLQAAGIDLLQQRCRLLIAQMTPRSCNSAFERQRIRPGGEHLSVVIGFDEQRIAGLVGINNRLIDAAEVGQYAQLFTRTKKQKLHRFAGIVGNRHRLHPNVTNAERLTIANKVEMRNHSQGAGVIGSRGHVHRQSTLARDQWHAADMVAMFMSDDHRTDAWQIELQALQSPVGLPRTETAINQNMRLAIADNSGIATAAASQGCKPQHAGN